MNTTETHPGRTRPRWLVPAVVAGGIVLTVVLALTQPWLLWIDEVADEQLPTVTSAPAEQADDEGPEGDDADQSGAAEEDDGEDAAEEDGTAGDGQNVPADATQEDAAATTPSPTPSASPEPSGPVQLASGSFISRDHTTSGEVAIVRLEDGSRVLTIEGLQTDNGPDLYVYLDDNAADGPEAEFDDGIDLGRLRGNVGDLVYEIPADVDLDEVASVGIWCDRFSSLFGAADLVWE